MDEWILITPAKINYLNMEKNWSDFGDMDLIFMDTVGQRMLQMPCLYHISWRVGWSVGCLGLTALWDSISVYKRPSPRERGRKKTEMIDERKMSKQPHPHPLQAQ